MKKLLQQFDKNILKVGVIFTSLFVVLYPKLPSVHINHTWVYVRLEDFTIALLGLIWIVQVVRRKVKLALPLGIPIIIYWLVGFASLAYCLAFIGPSLPNFFPSIAVLEYFRRIEYMILFFIGFSSIQSIKDLKDYIRFLFIGVGLIILYAMGQHFYPYFWKYLPNFIQKTNFCFPSFQTGNEEFAKGIPLCLPVGSRVTSTFGGHYDLAGYLLIVLPIILGTWFIVKRKLSKVVLGILFLTGLITLILTSSRLAFGAYLFAIIPPLVLLGKKKWVVPILALSMLCLVLFSASTINRFMQTFRITSVVVNMQGQVIGTTEGTLSSDLQKQLAAGNKAIQANQVIQGVVPEGSSFIIVPQKRIATSSAVIQRNLSVKDAERLKLANGGLQLSTIKGNFSVQKALVYDISVTTRLQGEWPHAIEAFIRNPLLGTGFSTLTLAVDNDYLRLLGESGFLGFISFVGIFLILGIYVKQLLPSAESRLARVFIYGLIGAVISLFVNATLFDIFEASKVAEPLWIMLGIGAGVLSLYKKRPVQYFRALRHIALTRISLAIYLLIVTLAVFWNSISNFFVGDDFIWLKWAATSTFSDVSHYFLNAEGFFYRPLDKTLMLLFYSIFSFQPQGYHVIILSLHFFMTLAVFGFLYMLFKRKLWAFIGSLLFLLLPSHAENIYWISSLSIDLSAVCMLFTLTLYIKSQQEKSWKSPIRFIISVFLSFIALLSYELAVVIPLLLIASDVIWSKNFSKKKIVNYIPFILLDIAYGVFRYMSHAVRMGGDYSYNLSHILPNIFGNILGYFGLFIFGEWSLSLYTILRSSSRVYAIPIAFSLLILIGAIIFLVRKYPWKKVLKTHTIPLFGFVIMLIGLLPYIALGNIAERYGYFASAGFIVIVIYFAQVLFAKLTTKMVKYALAIGITALLLFWCLVSLQKSAHEWYTAAKTTYNTLGYFKIEYPTFPSNSTLIVMNRPIKYGNAWVFPVGLQEGLWFVYADESPIVRDASTLQEARQLSSIKHSFIFTFDSQGNIRHIQ